MLISSPNNACQELNDSYFSIVATLGSAGGSEGHILYIGLTFLLVIFLISERINI